MPTPPGAAAARANAWNCGLDSRSGATYMIWYQPSLARLSTVFCCPGVSVELRYAGRAPAALSENTWSAMSETSGLTTSVSPGSMSAGTW